MISPHVEITDADALWIRDALADEFGFRRDFVTLVKHAKPRLNEALPAPHFHLLAAEFDPEVSTKVLSSAWSFARHEKVARLAELYLGHRITPGPHQGAVVRHLEAEGETEAADALRPIDPPRAAADPRTGWDAPTAAPIVRASRSPSDTIGGVRDAFVIASSASEFLASLASIGLEIRPGQRRATTPCVYAGDQHLGALHRILGRQVAEVRAFLAPPPSQGDEIGAQSAHPSDAPPPAVYLTDDEVAAVFDRMLSQVTTADVDRTEVLRIEGMIKRSSKMARDQREKIEKTQDERATTIEGLRNLGWFGRHIFRRRQARDLIAKIAEADARIADVEQFLNTVAEAQKPLMKPLRRARQLVESREADATIKRQRERDRLAELKLLTLDRSMIFATEEEVEEFAAERHAQDGFVIKRPTIFDHVRHPDPDAGRAPGGL